MSRPYQFAEEKSTRSPLDRSQPNLYPAGQPPSFKTNVNRAKTKRWVEAKAVSYGGDDWGDYDEYDEYGADEPPPEPPSNPSVPTGLRQKGQSATEAGRSFTDPQPPRHPSIPRKNSFDAGDERRAFSSAAPQGFPTNSSIDTSAAGRNGGFGEAAPPQNQQYVARTVAQPQPINTQVPPGNRQPSASQSEVSDTPQHRRDFSPSALPPPLHTRASPAPGSASGSPAGARFPPRKSSISNPSPSEALGPHFPTSVPASASAQSPRGRAPSNPTKPLPFIRPADIYKRVEEERVKERQSLDSGRPSLDSLSSRPAEESTAGRDLRERGSAESFGRTGRRPSIERFSEAGESGRSLQPLEPVVERKSEYLPDFNIASQGPPPSTSTAQQRPAVQTYHPIALPEVQRMSGFADDFSPRYFAPDSASSQTATSLPPPQSSTIGSDPGLRSMVDQAFTRNDDNSIPPTPVSNRDTYSQSGDGVSRSNTESSYGISPIMSRVPSSATSALKARNIGGAESSTPAIAEETSETSTPTSRPPSGAMLGDGYKVNRKPSPAHSRNVSSGSLVGTPPHQTGLHTPSPAESPARSPAFEPQKAIPEPEAAVLSTLNPLSSGKPIGGDNSTLPNYATREADIATDAKKLPDAPGLAVGEAEKESQRSFLESHQGMTSDLERAPRSRSESPNKGRVQELAGKFGGISESRRGSTHSSIASWERSQEDLPSMISANKSKPSTRDSSPVKEPLSLRPTADREPSFRPKLPGQWESYATTAPTPLEQLNKDRQLGGGLSQAAADVEKKTDGDEEVDLTPTTQRHSAAPPKSDALAALQAAGSAMGEAIKASVGMGASDADTNNTAPKAASGNVFLRPLQLDRTVSSAESSNPPSPPPKDDSFEDLTPGPHEMNPTRPPMLPQLSTDPSPHDQESDKLRKDIVRTLSPLKQSDSSLQLGAPTSNNRESSILPSEYDSYWADGDLDKDVARQSVVQPRYGNEAVPAPSARQSASEPRPGLLDNRFSWERSADSGPEISNASTVPPSQAETVASPSAARAGIESPHDDAYARVPEPYFGPGHATSGAQIVPQVAEPDAKPENKSLLDQSEVNKKAESPVHDQVNELTSPISLNRPSSSEGLHVVNSAIDPEAVDMPPRLAEEVAEEREAQQKVEEALQAPRPTSHEAPLGPRPPTAKSSQPISPSGKPLGFREILAIRSASDRIATYNKTRDYWATTDHGLNEWMSKTLAANPEHASLSSLTSRPTIATPASGSLRHRPTASISLFGKSTASNAQQPATPYYEQYNAAASQMPPGAPPTTPGGTPSHQTPSTGGTGTRITSHQLEKKGKDLLHTAGIFGGKATTGAKGLFAKGKSRFKSSGSDKASRSSISSAPTSREPSEEPPEWVTAPNQFENGRSSVDQGDLKDKKRRLSSPFRRSRSRPTSIVLPMNQHFDLANGSVHSRNTPPRETPPTEGSRPQSYAAPESWNIHDPHSQHNSWNNQEQPSQHDVNMTPPRTLGAPDRLGVLPSPAKSAFSLAQAERDGEVPPVPPIPSDMEGWQQQHEREREIQSHRNLQSVIRHSTPPVTDALRTQSTDLAASQQPVDQQAEQAVGQHAETRAEYEKKEPSWPLVSNPPSPDKMDELPQAPMSGQAQVYDEDDQPPQLSHNLLPTSRAIPGHVHAEEVDDNDRPPQLHYEALPASAPPGQLHRSADVSPTSGPQASDHGDISPVVSSDDHDASDDDDDRAPPPLDLSFLSSNSQPTRDRLANISPVAAARQASVASDGAPAAIRPDGREGTSTPTPRPAYETEQIGVGDVSPVSSRGNDFAGTATDEPTPTKAVVGPSDGRPVVAPVNVTAPRQPFASNAAAVANTTYKGVDDDYEPSRSSLDSWENGSVEEQLSLRDDRPSAARHYSQEGVATVVTPQSAKTVQVGSYFRPQGVEQAQATIPQAAQPSTQHERVPQVIAREPSQPSQVSAFAGAHRSQSLLSTISKAVSAEGVADSPVSDRSGRAGDIPLLPQTLHVPAQQRNSEHLSPIHDDGFDLYADHNGIVKDLHDERTGEPVRIPPMPSAPAPQPPRQQPSPIVTPVPKQETHRSVESPVTRRGGNMGSRPMSFVSLPRDAKGRPQEQINREMYPEDGEREQLSGQPASPQVSSSVQQPLASAPTSPRAQEQNDHVSPPLGPPAPSFAPPLVALATSKAVGRGLTDGERQPQALAPPQPVAPMQGQQDPLQGRGGSVLPQQQAVGQLPPQGQSRQDSRMHDPKVQDPRLQDPRLLNDPKVQQLQTQDRRMQDSRIQDPRMQIGDPRVQAPPGQTVGPMGPGQPIFRDPRQQGTAPGQLYSPQDPRLQGRTPGQVSPQDPRMQGAQFPPPRNEYEAQQQMMARQAMDPRLLGAEYQLPGVGPPAREGQANTPDSGRPKLGSVFKKLGSRQTPPPAQVTPNDRINPQLMSPDDQHRAFSYQSSVGDLPTEQIRDKKKERKSSIFTSTNSRPQSVGTASQFSQESRVAHAADSRVDLRYPTSPAPFKGIPPQVPPPGAPQPPKPQPQRASTSLLPDGGKKRRFSGLGSLFGRHGSTGHVPPTKPQKLSKEEKKRQKAPIQQPQQLQNPTQGYGQPPVFPQQYAPQPQQPRAGPGMPSPQGAQQYIPPQQQGMPLQYLPQGVQGYAPQRTSMQPPPGAQGYGVPTQQYYGQPPNPSEAYRQPQYPPSAQRGQQTLPFPAQTSPGSQQYPSAYGETRLLAQSATQQPPSFPPSVSPIPPPQSRQMSPQNSRPGPPPTNPSFEHTVGRINEEGETPPPGGFYAPGRFSHDHGNVGYGAIAQEAATSPHPQNQRRVSSPTSMHGSTNGLSSPVSQRSVSSPISEPRYETPQIPAAYSNGAAKYAAPTARTPSLPNQLATAARKSSSPSPYNGPVRQYSDSHRPAMGSPQVSGQSQYDSAAAGDHRGSTSPRVVSPVSNPSPGRPPQQIQQGKSPRMGSISEATRSHQERPYNISLPIDEGVENEAAYIKHQQMLQQQMEAQNQAQVSRNGNTPSPNPPQGHGRPISTQGTTGALAGFKEVLPRHSPQPYQIPPPQQQHSSPHSQQMQLQQHPHSRTPEPAQPAPIRPSQLQAGGPVQPAAYPLPMSPDLANAASPVNPMTAMLPPPPPPSVPHEKIVPHHHNNDVTADEAPPSYSTHEQPSQIFNDEKTYPPQSPTLQPPPPQMPPPSHIPAPQPPPQQEYVPGDGPNERGRKPSLSILQHPQPSTMAASPSRSSIEMGSAILRQRLLEQEERERVERLQKSELERVESERERAERDRARARARELERSRGSVRGYHMGAIGSSGQRPVAFELSAEEDEPVMRGVSYPGMEWTPAWEGD